MKKLFSTALTLSVLSLTLTACFDDKTANNTQQTTPASVAHTETPTNTTSATELENKQSTADTPVSVEPKEDAKENNTAEESVTDNNSKPLVSNAKSSPRKHVQTEHNGYSAEEIRLGLDQEKGALTSQELEYQKNTCRYKFATEEEAKKYNCVLVPSVVR